MLKRIVIVIILCAMLIPTVTHSQNAIQAEAMRDATNDIKLLNSQWWYLVGCIFSIGSLGMAVVYDPPVPAKRFVGKSPEYIAHYTAAYVNTSRQQNLSKAFVGCLVGGIVPMAIAYIRYN